MVMRANISSWMPGLRENFMRYTLLLYSPR